MTTIVYDHNRREIDIDSRITCGSRIDRESYDKTIQRSGAMWFLCGASAETELFVDSFTAGETGKEYDVSAIVADGGKVYHCTYSAGRPLKSLLTYSDSIGSGSDYAIAAIDMGANAEDALKAAIRRDVYTGGNVRVFIVDKMEFV